MQPGKYPQTELRERDFRGGTVAEKGLITHIRKKESTSQQDTKGKKTPPNTNPKNLARGVESRMARDKVLEFRG